MFRFILFVLILSLHLFAKENAFDSTFSLGKWNSEISAILDLTVSQKYKDAFLKLETFKTSNANIACVLEGIIHISRYDDLGDTLSLFRADTVLNRCKSIGYWDALRVFEIGYVQSELGHSFKGAMSTKNAAGKFEDSENTDARAFYAIYAYYMNDALNWIPFISDKREKYLKDLTFGAKNSAWFWPLFTTSLIWMHYDRKEYEIGLELADSVLKKIPEHPVFLQIKADMLYRLERYSEAAVIYESSAKNYFIRTGYSIRYFCAAANLIRIYHDMNNAEKETEWKSVLKSEAFLKIKHWMPKSLMEDLKDKDLLD